MTFVCVYEKTYAWVYLLQDFVLTNDFFVAKLNGLI